MQNCYVMCVFLQSTFHENSRPSLGLPKQNLWGLIEHSANKPEALSVTQPTASKHQDRGNNKTSNNGKLCTLSTTNINKPSGFCIYLHMLNATLL